MRALLGRLGHFWYVIPCGLILLAGLATCSFIDVTDHDRFEVDTVVADRSGMRVAVMSRQYHADSGTTVRCVFIVAGPAPSLGSSKRLAPSCTAIATRADLAIAPTWKPNGRLELSVEASTTSSPTDGRDQACYFHADKRPNHICYRDEIIDIVVAKRAKTP